MRGLFKIFAFLTFVGECISALGTVYPRWEEAWNVYQARKEALKTPEEKAEEEAERIRKQNEANFANTGMYYEKPKTEDVPYEEVKSNGTDGGGLRT